jgi:hypothetical protein
MTIRGKVISLQRRVFADLLFGRSGHGVTKSLGFAPNLANLLAKLSDSVCDVQDHDCDHGY